MPRILLLILNDLIKPDGVRTALIGTALRFRRPEAAYALVLRPCHGHQLTAFVRSSRNLLHVRIRLRSRRGFSACHTEDSAQQTGSSKINGGSRHIYTSLRHNPRRRFCQMWNPMRQHRFTLLSTGYQRRAVLPTIMPEVYINYTICLYH